TIDSRPFERVCARCVVIPISLIKSSLSFRISSGVCPDNTLISILISPFTIMASLSALKNTFPSLKSEASHTVDWHPFTLFSFTLNRASRGGSFFPRSIIYSYLSSQESNKENSSTISFSVALWFFLHSFLRITFLLLFASRQPAHPLLPGYYIRQKKPGWYPEYGNIPSGALRSDDPFLPQSLGCPAISRYPAGVLYQSQKISDSLFLWPCL